MTVLRIGATPEAFKGHGLYMNGDTPEAKRATLSIDERAGGLIIQWGPEEGVIWSLADIRKLRDQAGGDMMVLRSRTDAVCRLLLTDPEDQRIIVARALDLDKAPPVENKGKLALLAGAAVASVAIMIVVLIPLLANSLATLLPREGERALGEATLTQIRAAMSESQFEPIGFCESPKGMAALAQMGASLFPNGTAPEDLTVHVVEGDLINAFALPGGIVVFFDGLIQAAETPEEVAAVYAHEVGHVVARDPTRIALRSAGSIGVLGLLFGDFAGGAMVLFLAERIISADYSQEAEANADSFAHEIMAQAGFPPSAMATFFDRLRQEHGDAPGIVQHFAAHPALGDRIEAAQDATPQDVEFASVLTSAEWADLQSICSG